MPSTALIDFGPTPLAASYSGFYAKVLDDVFSPEECVQLIAHASSCPEGWQPAGLNGLTGEVYSDFRNSERVYLVDEELSSRIYERLRPLVEEDIGLIGPKGQWNAITGKAGREQGPTWKLSCLNPRLSFLRYGPGHYFKPHCDGLNESPDGKSKSFVTIHLYLTDETSEAFFTSSAVQSKRSFGDTGNTSESPLAESENTETQNPSKRSLVGGATRFWTPNKKEFLDVEPKAGRVLVFQQRMLVHSGEEVKSGMKYTMRGDLMFCELGRE
ncbi:hypothetical protein VKT23_007950 [Stygiomarasmius scandens]|uniref:Prolyl 4-hydroxylase alpha subunit domain-containing protein n=1 Tax=Marasmiellus scandens TaxID=2682957 RepID=A0ABR1JQ20_9AGAR